MKTIYYNQQTGAKTYQEGFEIKVELKLADSAFDIPFVETPEGRMANRLKR